MKRRQLLGLSLLCLLLSAGGLRAELTVSDFEGRELTLKTPAQRIVALAPHIVENLFSAGAGDRLVGVVSHSDYPAAAQRIAQVGDYKRWSLESIAALQPDLIVMWASGNGLDSLAQLERLGVPVFVSELRRLDDIPLAIRRYGQLTDTSKESEAEAARLEQAFATLRAAHARQRPVSVFYQVWNDPLQTLNDDHLISRVIELCGGRNAFGDIPHLAPKINIESVLARDPDVIIASGMGEARPDWLDRWQAYPALTAVKRKQLYFVNPDHIQRPTSRVLLGAAEVCQQLTTARRQPS